MDILSKTGRTSDAAQIQDKTGAREAKERQYGPLRWDSAMDLSPLPGTTRQGLLSLWRAAVAALIVDPWLRW
jgi:hypothetical protein